MKVSFMGLLLAAIVQRLIPALNKCLDRGHWQTSWPIHVLKCGGIRLRCFWAKTVWMRVQWSTKPHGSKLQQTAAKVACRANSESVWEKTLLSYYLICTCTIHRDVSHKRADPHPVTIRARMLIHPLCNVFIWAKRSVRYSVCL